MTITDTTATPAPAASRRLTTSKAMVEAIAQEMERDPSVIYLGEDVGAWVVLVPGATADGDELSAFCAERLSPEKVPRSWTFVDRLPRNPTGKVVKADLPGRP